MKRMLVKTMLSAVIVATATPVLSLIFRDEEAMFKYDAEQAQKWKETVERTKEALKNNDDNALRREIFQLYGWIEPAGSQPVRLMRLMRDCGIPPEKVLDVLGKAIRKALLAMDKTPDERRVHNHIDFGIELLYALPESEEILALIKECLQSKNPHVRANVEKTVEWHTRRETRKEVEQTLKLIIEYEAKINAMAQASSPEPSQPPEATAATATVENTLPPADTVETPSSNVPATTTQPPSEPDATKSVPWKLPLLIGIIVIGGAVAAWCRLKGKNR